MATALVTQQILNEVRRTLSGPDASLRLFKLTPDAGEETLLILTTDWCPWRKRAADQGPTKTKVLLDAEAVCKADWHIGATIEICTLSDRLKYQIAELLPYQQLAGGLLLMLEPLSPPTAL